MSSYAEHWDLDPELTFLNHGSFGACPRVVLAEQARLRTQMEHQPVLFHMRELEGLLDAARVELAEFVGAEPANLAFVPNATTGVNAVLRSLPLEAGDTLLATSHGYNAVRNTLDFVAQRAGARVVVAEVPFPIEDPQQVVEAVLATLTPTTRLAILDHVTSPTGLVFPIEELVAALAERGVDTLVDGAHAPGMLPLELEKLGAAYYTGNCHKWVCAPKGAAFLYVRADRQAQVRPTVISHGANAKHPERSRLRLEFDWVGTQDPSAYLCVPTAIRFLRGLLPGGWPELRERNRSLVLAARRRVCDQLETAPVSPDSMIGFLAAHLLPSAPSPEPPAALLGGLDPLQAKLYEQHWIEVPVFPFPAPPQRVLRISAHVHNSAADYERLVEALAESL